MELLNFDIIRELSRGGYGEVYLVKSKVNLNNLDKDQLAAMKIIKKQKFKSIATEIKVLKEVEKKQFLSQMIGCFQDHKDAYIVMRYEQNGSLDQMLKIYNKFDITFARTVLVDILLGLQYLHGLGILHGDLKPANILIDSNHRSHVADFGLAKNFMNDVCCGMWGTPRYQSPEQLIGKDTWDEKIDIFIAAIIFIEMLTGRHPFDNGSNIESDIHMNIVNLKYNIPVFAHSDTNSFIWHTLCYDNLRLNRHTIMKHRYIEPLVKIHIDSFRWAYNIIDTSHHEPYYNQTQFLKNISGIPCVNNIKQMDVYTQTHAIDSLNKISNNIQVLPPVAEQNLARGILLKRLRELPHADKERFTVKPDGYYVYCQCGKKYKAVGQGIRTKNWTIQALQRHILAKHVKK